MIPPSSSRTPPPNTTELPSYLGEVVLWEFTVRWVYRLLLTLVMNTLPVRFNDGQPYQSIKTYLASGICNGRGKKRTRVDRG